MKLKPKPYSLGCGGYELLYKCPKCEGYLNMATSDWHFCPYCGQEFDWGVVSTVNEEWKRKFLEALDNPIQEAQMLEIVEELNSTITDGREHSMIKTDATKKAITKSNISYYLGIGWTKEELIAKGFFAQEDFENFQ